MTEKEQFAYCAGLLDGEGCFHASRNDHCNTFRYGITVNLDYEKPLLKLKGMFGGEVKPINAGGFCWAIPKHLLMRCLESVIPYLMIKRRQAELLRELRMTFQNTGRKRGQAPPVEVVNHRQVLTNEITSLKEEYSLKPIPVLPKVCLHTYAAGILDAEGSFGIYHGKGNRFVAKVQIGMVDPTSVTAICPEFSGFMIHAKTGHKNEVHYAVFERKAAVEISKSTKPYRLLKIEQSDLVVLMQNHIDLWHAKRPGGSTPLPQEVIVQREKWYQRCRSLNSESVRAETNPSRPTVVSDSPNCIEPSDAEPEEIAGRYAIA